jgi:uncharacterized protein (DUF2062 family)
MILYTNCLRNYLKSKIYPPVLTHLKKGMSVKKLSLTISLGICVGIMPAVGIGTWILVVLAIVLKLNIPVIQLVNHAIIILKLILFVPFLKLGQVLFFPSQSQILLQKIVVDYQHDFAGTLQSVWHLYLGGILIWAMMALPLGFLIYRKSHFMLKRQQIKMDSNNGPGNMGVKF